MKKIINTIFQSLYIELTVSVIFSFLVGSAFYFLLSIGAESIAYSKWAYTSYTDYKISVYLDNLQTYIYKEQISTTNTAPLIDWWEKDKNVFFYITDGDTILYNSFMNPDKNGEIPKFDADDAEFTDALNDYQAFFPKRRAHDIRLIDTKAKIYILADFQYSIYNTLHDISIAISALVIILILIAFVRRKIHYIKDVTYGINILEGGNLHYQIPVKGNDELTQVATSLNSMRVALDQQMKNETKAIQANNSLVTALSHDLRTPLTTQMGYLEILKEHHYSSPEEMDKYINTALDTCHQIKEMSDRLFEYFLAFDPHPERPAEALEEFDGVELFMQLISELSLPLESKGLSFEIEDPMDSFLIHVNMNDILRVFNNVFTNIDKYADESEPVKIRIYHDNENAVLSISNKIRKEPRKNESAKIGLISISSLMKRQGGASKTVTSKDKFTIELKFPIY